MPSTSAVNSSEQRNNNVLSFIDRAHDTCIQRIVTQLECINVNSEQAEKAFRTFASDNVNHCPELLNKAEFESSRFDAHAPRHLFSVSAGSIIGCYSSIIVKTNDVVCDVAKQLQLNPSLDLNMKWILSVVCMYISHKASEAEMSTILSELN